MQVATDMLEDSRKPLVEAQTALQQAGRLPTREAEGLRAALRDLWRSERDELRVEARQFVEDAVAKGHLAFETALPDPNAPRKSRRSVGTAQPGHHHHVKYCLLFTFHWMLFVIL